MDWVMLTNDLAKDRFWVPGLQQAFTWQCLGEGHRKEPVPVLIANFVAAHQARLIGSNVL